MADYHAPRVQLGARSGQDNKVRRCRDKTVLLLAAAFAAGIAIVPTSGLIARGLTRALGFSTAFAQDTDRTETYRLLALFGDAFELVRSE